MNFKKGCKTIAGFVVLAFILLSAVSAFAGPVTYTYDAANRLTTANNNGNVTHYVYDKVGNLQQRSALLTVTPPSKDFGSMSVGSASTAQTFTITNTGTENFTISSVSKAGADALSFTLASDNCSGTTIAPAGTCTMQATFSPVARGNKSANISISFSDPADLSVNIPVSGMALGSIISALPASLAFESMNVGAASAPQSVTISNSGEVELLLGALTGTNEFQIVTPDNCSGKTIAPSGGCSVQVVFAPANGGQRSASLSIPSNDGSNPVIFVSLTGIGLAPIIAASPSSLEFGGVGIGTTSLQNLMVLNTGTTDLQIGTLAVTGTNASEFQVVTPDGCSGHTITPSGSCPVQILFSPAAPNGQRSAGLSIPSNAPANPSFNVSLTGSAFYPYVKIARTPAAYFSTLQAAYDAAADGETIQSQAVTFVEDLNINRAVTVRLDGGFNSDFSTVTGQSIVHGQIHTISGAMTITNLKTQQ